MVQYNLDAANKTNYRDAAEAYIHYLHGVNPIGIAFLTNASAFGGDKFTQEIYHGWFGDGTKYDGTAVPYIGAPPAFIPGGVNPSYSPDATYSGPPIFPPQNQPVQKSYKDWNTSYPENSWEISEVGIYVNAAYVKLLSKFADSTTVLTSAGNLTNETNNFVLFPNPASNIITVILGETNQSEITAYDLLGKEVWKWNLVSGKNILKTSNLENGIYFFKTTVNGQIQTKKIIICKE
jgi:hypothetical protein